VDISVSCAKLGSSEVAAKSDINRYVVVSVPGPATQNVGAFSARVRKASSAVRSRLAVAVLAAGIKRLDHRLTAAPSPLTPREAEVLAIAQEDRHIREVARVVFLSPPRVRNYLATITKKLEAGSRAEAYRIARENGWI
jgi:DNA-binding CsgD family transcriptional regulator